MITLLIEICEIRVVYTKLRKKIEKRNTACPRITRYNKKRGGFKVEVTEDGTLHCFASGENANFTVESSINLCDGKKHHVAWIMDTAACISYLVIDGIFDNGGEIFECGWRFIPRQLSFISPVKNVDFGENVTNAKLIQSSILTYDAIGDWRASLQG